MSPVPGFRILTGRSQVMVSIVPKLMLRVAVATWSSNIIGALTGATAEGLSNTAMQQDGLGLLLTVLIVSAPPIAAQFFGGTLGQFMSYAQVNGGVSANRPGPQGQPPGAWGGTGSPTAASVQTRPVETQVGNSGGFNRPVTQAPTPDAIKPHQSEAVRT